MKDCSLRLQWIDSQMTQIGGMYTDFIARFAHNFQHRVTELQRHGGLRGFKSGRFERPDGKKWNLFPIAIRVDIAILFSFVQFV